MSSVIEFIRDYENDDSKYGIPEFQRKYTWDAERVEGLFDSILRGFPLPRFFTWKLSRNIGLNLYKIVKEFNVGTYISESFQLNEYNDTIAICDGQQRLTSLIIGLTGKEFSRREGGALCGYLHYNLLFDDLQLENRAFKFIKRGRNVQKENLEDGNLYVEVGYIYQLFNHCGGRFGQFWSMFEEQNRESFFVVRQNEVFKIQSNLMNFINSITQQHYLDFQDLFPKIGDDLDKAIEFFERINAKGKALSKNEILFAIISKHLIQDGYRHIRLREDFDAIIETNDTLSSKIDYSFLLRACLYLSSNSILFKINTFDQVTCQSILDNWEEIKNSIHETLKLVKEFKFEKSITSLNSLIPVIFHMYKKQNIVNNTERNEILIYLLRAKYCKTFGSQADNLLANLKNKQNNKFELNPDYQFCFDDFNINLPTNKSFNTSQIIIENLIENLEDDKKDNVDLIPIMLLLYPHLNVNNPEYKVVNIHPQLANASTNTALMFLGIGDPDIRFIKNNRKKISVLQLVFLDDTELTNKESLSLLDYVTTYHAGNSTQYLTNNYMVNEGFAVGVADLHNNSYSRLFSYRKEAIRLKLVSLLCN